jgi:hypothetical protein
MQNLTNRSFQLCKNAKKYSDSTLASMYNHWATLWTQTTT